MKKAIVIGHTGQDGNYLCSLLQSHSYDLIGISSTSTFSSRKEVKQNVDIRNYAEVAALLKSFEPQEVYYLAAVHQSSADKAIPDGELFLKSMDVNVNGVVNFLEAIRIHSPQSKFFYAASSHVFGNPKEDKQNEYTALQPVCIYGTTKTAGLHTCHYYRNTHKVFASVGIFYNHESPRRESKYVSKKIIETAVAIKNKRAQELVLGNLESKIDWGYAPDYMQAVHLILQQDLSNDYIVSSGELHSVREFVEETFRLLNLDWKQHVKINPNLITKNQKRNLFGDNCKLINETGWKPTVNFREMIQILVNEELKKQTAR